MKVLYNLKKRCRGGRGGQGGGGLEPRIDDIDLFFFLKIPEGGGGGLLNQELNIQICIVQLRKTNKNGGVGVLVSQLFQNLCPGRDFNP